MQNNTLHPYLSRFKWRRISIWVLVILSLVLVADTLRIVFAPPGRQIVSTYRDTQISVNVDRKFIWSYDTCVNVTWDVTNAVDVYFNGDPAPRSNSITHCLSPTPPQPQPKSENVANWNYGHMEHVYTTLTQYPDVVVMARVHENIDTVLHVSAPIYVLADDVLWLWRVVLAAGLLTIAGYLGAVKPVRRIVNQGQNLLKRNAAFATFCGVFAVILIVFATQTIYPLRILTALASFAAENGFVPITFAWGAIAQTIGILTLFTVAGALVGAATLRLVDDTLLKDAPFGRLATSLVLGQGVLALLWLLLGIFGALTPINIYITLLLCILTGSISGKRLLTDTRYTLRGTQRLFSNETLIWKSLLVLSVMVMLIATLRVFMNINRDGHTTYMTQAKIIAATGNLDTPARTGDLHYAASGFIGEISIAAAYSLAGDAAARMHSWTVFVAVILAGIATARALDFSRRGQIIALVALTTSSLTYGLVGQGKVDIYGFAPALGAILVAITLVRDARSSAAMLVGLLAGIAIVAKITYLPTLGVFLLAWTMFTTAPKHWIRLWLFMTLGALIPIGIFVLRNTLVLEQPLAPFIVNSSEYINIETVPQTSRERLLRQSTLFYPITWFGAFSDSTLVYLTPVWLILLPVILWRLFSKHTPRLQRTAIGVSILTLFIWSIIGPNILPLRYQAAIFALCLLLGSQGIADILSTSRSPLIQTALKTSLYFAFFAVIIGEMALVGGRLVVPTNHYNCRPTPAALCEGVNELNTVAPPNSRILTNMPFYYYLREDLILCRAEKSDHIRLIGQTPEQIWTDLYDNGYRYALDWQVENIWHAVSRQYSQIYPVVPLYPDAAPDWLTVTTLFESDAMRLYQLEPNDPPHPPTADVCNPNTR